MGAPLGTEVNRGEEAAEMGRGALGRRHSLGEGLWMTRRAWRQDRHSRRAGRHCPCPRTKSQVKQSGRCHPMQHWPCLQQGDGPLGQNRNASGQLQASRAQEGAVSSGGSPSEEPFKGEPGSRRLLRLRRLQNRKKRSPEASFLFCCLDRLRQAGGHRQCQ